ncbi:MAG: nucleoside recognition protein [Desulfobacteraceae bacterium]|jgi:hypothetical protein
MNKHNRKSNRPALALSFTITVLVLAVGVFRCDDIPSRDVTAGLLWPLCRLMFFIGVGLFVGQFIEATGWTRALAALARPLFRFGRMGSLCSAAFTTAFFSGAAANAMLYDAFREGKISKKELFAANIVNHLPAYFLHLPTTLFIVLPLTGWAGVFYFLITFLATVFRMVAALLFGRLAFGGPTGACQTMDSEHAGPPAKPGKPFWKSIRPRLMRRFGRIAVYVVPIYTVVFVVNASGGFAWAREALAGAVTSRLIPMESISLVVLSFAAEFTSGFAAAGALMDAGMLNVKQTTLALLIGNVVAFPIRALRHQLPRYMGIFSPVMGLQLLGTGQGLRVLSLMLFGCIYYWIV